MRAWLWCAIRGVWFLTSGDKIIRQNAAAAAVCWAMHLLLWDTWCDFLSHNQTMSSRQTAWRIHSARVPPPFLSFSRAHTHTHIIVDHICCSIVDYLPRCISRLASSSWVFSRWQARARCSFPAEREKKQQLLFYDLICAARGALPTLGRSAKCTLGATEQTGAQGGPRIFWWAKQVPPRGSPKGHWPLLQCRSQVVKKDLAYMLKKSRTGATHQGIFNVIGSPAAP